MRNNVIDFHAQRSTRPARKRRLSDAEQFALEVITLDVTDAETTALIKHCLGYTQ